MYKSFLPTGLTRFWSCRPDSKVAGLGPRAGVKIEHCSGGTNCFVIFIIIFYYLDCTKCEFPDFSLTFPNIHFFPDLQQNSLTFPWLLPSLEFPWLFPDRWTPWYSCPTSPSFASGDNFNLCHWWVVPEATNKEPNSSLSRFINCGNREGLWFIFIHVFLKWLKLDSINLRRGEMHFSLHKIYGIQFKLFCKMTSICLGWHFPMHCVDKNVRLRIKLRHH